MKNLITYKELQKATQVPYYRIDYLIRCGKIPINMVERYGSGKKRMFSPRVIQIINQLENPKRK
ncbi:hypothetical protein HNV12_19280 [Methanococcoides sp. SA1]|nr:hypothetical protein [Methanococcoides sp. SA1]